MWSSKSGKGKNPDSCYSDRDHVKDRKNLPQALEPDQHGNLGLPEELKSFGEHCQCLIGNMDAVEGSHRVALQRFSDSLQACVRRAEIFEKKPDKDKYKTALCDLHNALGMSSGPLAGQGQLLVPGPQAAEEACVQPYLIAILQSLLDWPWTLSPLIPPKARPRVCSRPRLLSQLCISEEHYDQLIHRRRVPYRFWSSIIVFGDEQGLSRDSALYPPICPSKVFASGMEGKARIRQVKPRFQKVAMHPALQS